MLFFGNTVGVLFSLKFYLCVVHLDVLFGDLDLAYRHVGCSEAMAVARIVLLVSQKPLPSDMSYSQYSGIR